MTLYTSSQNHHKVIVSHHHILVMSVILTEHFNENHNSQLGLGPQSRRNNHATNEQDGTILLRLGMGMRGDKQKKQHSRFQPRLNIEPLNPKEGDQYLLPINESDSLQKRIETLWQFFSGGFNWFSNYHFKKCEQIDEVDNMIWVWRGNLVRQRSQVNPKSGGRRPTKPLVRQPFSEVAPIHIVYYTRLSEMNGSDFSLGSLQ